MEVDHGEGRAAFLAALHSLMSVADRLDDEQLLAASRCRGWTVGDVLVHVHLGLQEMLLGLVTGPVGGPVGGPVAPPGGEPDTDAASYWRSPPPATDPGAGQVAQVRFVRLMGAAYRRPVGLVAHLRPTAAGLAAAVGAAGSGVVSFQGHTLTTGDFLATWAVELAVHHLDLGVELELPPPDPSALSLARATVEALAGEALPAAWDDATATLLGTGRLRPDQRQAEEAGPVAARLPVLG